MKEIKQLKKRMNLTNDGIEHKNIFPSGSKI